MINKEVIVIGAGLAGSEAAWQIANAGIAVKLVEMRPLSSTPAHHTCEFAELVCSNSFGALSHDRAAGLCMLKTTHAKAAMIGAKTTIVLNILKSCYLLNILPFKS